MERLGCDKPGQSSPDFPTHLKMRAIPHGALKQKPKVQIKKDSLIDPRGVDFLGRIPSASCSRLGEQQGRHPPTGTQDPCRQGSHVHRGLLDQSGGARLRLFLRSLTTGIWCQAGETKWPGWGSGYPRKPEVKMGCGW